MVNGFDHIKMMVKSYAIQTNFILRGPIGYVDQL